MKKSIIHRVCFAFGAESNYHYILCAKLLCNSLFISIYSLWLLLSINHKEVILKLWLFRKYFFECLQSDSLLCFFRSLIFGDFRLLCWQLFFNQSILNIEFFLFLIIVILFLTPTILFRNALHFPAMPLIFFHDCWTFYIIIRDKYRRCLILQHTYKTIKLSKFAHLLIWLHVKLILFRTIFLL